jgi:hypothetical protein
MWTYNSANGSLSRNGELVGVGYSGRGVGLNNPSMESVPDRGPIPRGNYTIGQFFTDPEKGPLVARLEPNEGTNDWGRSGFMIHGDNQQMNETGSEGCIVMPRSIRQAVANSGDNELLVA